MQAPDARRHLESLIGRTIHTLTGQPNRILGVDYLDVWVATNRSPDGKPVPIADVQDAVDRLFARGELEISVQSVGFRSAFIGAVLASLPGTRAELRPRRIVVEDRGGATVATPRAVSPTPPGDRTGVTSADPSGTVRVLLNPQRRARAWAVDTVDGLDSAGLYAWFVDADGAKDLAIVLGSDITEGLIYAGEAGGGSSLATLGSRIRRQHLNGNTRSSTFRLALASVLSQRLQLRSLGDRHTELDSERRLSRWMHDHLSVAVVPVTDHATLAAFEAQVLAELDPPLNLAGMRPSAVRTELSRLRRQYCVVP